MIKKWIALTSAGGLALISAWAFGAREDLEFYVSVDIPTQAFYVIPSEPDWIHREQILYWNVNTSTLGSLRRNFDVRNDSGAIEARLETIPYLTNVRNSQQHIILRVFFNGQQLQHDLLPSQVVSADDARAGARVLLEIQPVLQFDGYRPGDYYGSVNIMFNAVAPQG